MRSVNFIVILACSVLCYMAYVAQPALSAEESEDEMVKFDLNGVFVEHVAKLASDFTRTNFIVSEKARGTRITIMSPKLIPTSQLLKTFESALDANGLAMVPDGEIMKIVPKETAP